MERSHVQKCTRITYPRSNRYSYKKTQNHIKITSSHDPMHDDANDPILKKLHYIDPGVIEYKRTVFKNLLTRPSSLLSGTELSRLSGGHKLSLTVQETYVILRVHKELWVDVNDIMWESMAELLNDWYAETTIRDKLPQILASPNLFDAIGYVPVPLKVRHEVIKDNEYMDDLNIDVGLRRQRDEEAYDKDDDLGYDYDMDYTIDDDEDDHNIRI